jgi:hypothetical protein
LAPASRQALFCKPAGPATVCAGCVWSWISVPLRLLLTILCLIPAAGRAADAGAERLIGALARAAPAINRQVLGKAVGAMNCAVASGIDPAQRLAVIDFSLPSSKQRLWIFDLGRRRLLVEDHVAHGRGSGDEFATRFSNEFGSRKSSLGLFRTAETYYGNFGLSLRMDGLEPGINDLARKRKIVIHSAEYVDPIWIHLKGGIGRSHGCPAVRPNIVNRVIENMKGGQFLFSYYPDPRWLKKSLYLNCAPERVASVVRPLLRHP